MHNLLLGTTKRMLKIWKKEKLITAKHYKKLQQSVDEMKTPAELGGCRSKLLQVSLVLRQISLKTGT